MLHGIARRVEEGMCSGVKILLVDDHPIVRAGLRSLLEEEPSLSVDHCMEAANVSEAMSSLKEMVPDLAIVDIALSGGDGMEWIKDVRAMGHTFPALFMSMFDERMYAERVLKAGGNGYLMKRELAEHLFEAVQTVLSGNNYLSEEVRQAMKFRGSSERTGMDRLSDREIEVFRLIGEGKTTKEVAAMLFISVKTVETYRSHLKKKLDLRNAAELAAAATRWVESATTEF